MRLKGIAVLLPILLASSGYGQNAQSNHNSVTPVAVVRMKALQNQVKNQQAEIDALRAHLGKLQQEVQDLTQMLVDEETDGSEDDDSADDPGAGVWLARSQTRQPRKNMIRNAHSLNPVCSGKATSTCASPVPTEDFDIR